MASVGVGRVPPWAIGGPWRSGPIRKALALPGDEAVAAESDADRIEGPDQGGAAGNFDAIGFKERCTINEKRDIGGGSADIKKDGISCLGAEGKAAHDACRWPGVHTFAGKFTGPGERYGAAVRLEDMTGAGYAQM